MNQREINFLPGNRIKINNYSNPWNNRELWHADLDLQIVRQSCKKVQTILEFGSYDGGDGIRYKYHFPEADVYSIEASPSCYRNVKTLSKYGLKVFNYAISDTIGEVDFYETYDSDNDNYAPCGAIDRDLCSTERLGEAPLRIEAPIRVPSLTVEKFCEQQSITSIDLMHVDVEGHALQCLTGLGKIRPKVIYIEVKGAGYNHSGPIGRLLRSTGYKKEIAHGDEEIWIHTQ